MQGCADPARAVVPLVRGYHEVAPLREDELVVLFGLMRARLERSVAMAAAQHAAAPDNDYLLISQRGRDASCSRGSRARTPSSRTSASATRAGTRRSPKARAESAQRLATTACAPVMDGDLASAPVLDLGAAMPPVDGPRDRPLRRGARDLHRARVPDAGRALADAAHGRRPVRARGDAGVRAARRRGRACARTAIGPATTAGCWSLRHGDFWTLHGHLDPTTLASRRGAGGRGDRAAGRAGGQRRLGAAPAPAALHGSGRATCPAWR